MTATATDIVFDALREWEGKTVPEIAQAIGWKITVPEIVDALNELHRERRVRAVPVNDAGCRYITWRKAVEA